jgi:hypothetical protein
MPQDKDFKRLVRTRMAATGEPYTKARSALDTRARDQRRDERTGWVDAMAEPATYHEAYRRLKLLSADVLLPLAVEGTLHSDWRIRRGMCRLLDDLAFTDESFAALVRCADDPEPRVRRAAVHSLGCQHCKPDGCVVDVKSVFERALKDPSRKVRQMAVGPLLYGIVEDWRTDLLHQIVSTDPSPILRRWAHLRLEELEFKRQSDVDRRQLPPDLVTKTERHPGKWVAISHGRIIDAGGHYRAMERTARKHGHDDVRTYWVAP